MTTPNKVVNLCQIAVGAGKFKKGDALIPSIQKTEAKAVILSETCGQNTAKKVRDKCRFYEIPVVVLDKGAFDQISSRLHSAFSVTDAGLAKAIVSAAESD